MFRMGLTHLMDVGMRNFDDENVASACEKIERDARIAGEQGRIQVMTPEFQCGIVRCAAELAMFSVWEILAYIKKHVIIQ